MFVYAHINQRILPMQRGDWYEDPLDEALKAAGVGEVNGAGTGTSDEGEVEYCGLDVRLTDPVKGLQLVAEVLTKLGVPKGSKLQVEGHDDVPIGRVAGLAVYLNGTDLPDAVYASEDQNVNDAIDTMIDALGDRGQLVNYWEGPTETALYFYGVDFEELSAKMQPVLDSHPLCARCRVVQIA